VFLYPQGSQAECYPGHDCRMRNHIKYKKKKKDFKDNLVKYADILEPPPNSLIIKDIMPKTNSAKS
jgi:hypothetical protein